MNKLTIADITQEDSVEKIVCDFLKDKNTEPMTPEISEMFIRFTMAPTVAVPEEKDWEEVGLPFQTQVMIKRCKVALDFECKDLAVYMLFTLLSEDLGSVILYSIMIQWYCKKNNIKEFTFDHIGSMFPMGFYSYKHLKEVWDMQKVRGSHPDNLLDYSIPLTSLRFENESV